jgi:hypothetical protein
MVLKKMEQMEQLHRQVKSLDRGKLNFDFNCLQGLAGLHTHHAPSLVGHLSLVSCQFKRYLKIRGCGDYSRHPLPLCVGFVEV